MRCRLGHGGGPEEDPGHAGTIFLGWPGNALRGLISTSHFNFLYLLGAIYNFLFVLQYTCVRKQNPKKMLFFL